jgi:hypothetical protein
VSSSLTEEMTDQKADESSRWDSSEIDGQAERLSEGERTNQSKCGSAIRSRAGNHRRRVRESGMQAVTQRANARPGFPKQNEYVAKGADALPSSNLISE